jgi:hypothetical protein
MQQACHALRMQGSPKLHKQSWSTCTGKPAIQCNSRKHTHYQSTQHSSGVLDSDVCMHACVLACSMHVGSLQACTASIWACSPYPAANALAPRLLLSKGACEALEVNICCCMAVFGLQETVGQVVAPAAEDCVALYTTRLQ